MQKMRFLPGQGREVPAVVKLGRGGLTGVWLAGAIAVSLVHPAPVSAAPFRVAIAVTATNLHLQATTVPAGQLVWYSGRSLGAITNVVATETAPAKANQREQPTAKTRLAMNARRARPAREAVVARERGRGGLEWRMVWLQFGGIVAQAASDLTP